MNREEAAAVLGIIIAILMVAIVIVATALQPMFEARAFNACTGGHATYFTAAFTELRITDCKN